jgi:YtoQ family protein
MYNVYLSGEIHTNWRDDIMNLAKEKGLDINFFSPQLNHEKSDHIGRNILGDQGSSFHNDHISSKINSIKTHTLMSKCDIVIVKFGEKYRQWNASFDAGLAYGLGKKIIVIHPDSFIHPLKEVDAVASAVATNEEQVIEILEYICN